MFYFFVYKKIFNYSNIISFFCDTIEMDDIKRIVIPVDNTEDSKNTVKKGIFFAKLLGIDVKIITVNDTHQFISSVILEEKLKKGLLVKLK